MEGIDDLELDLDLLDLDNLLILRKSMTDHLTSLLSTLTYRRLTTHSFRQTNLRLTTLQH